MKLKEFLSNVDNQEMLIDRLKLLDKSIMELHEHGYYVVSGMNEIDIINDEITLASFKNKIDYLNSGINPNGDKQDILEMCSIGICAFNKFDTFYTSKEFISYIIDNLEMYLENGRIPSIIQEYYIDVFARGNVDYLNNFIAKHEELNGGKGNERAYVKTKSTAVGRALSEKNDAAYTNILLIPAIITLVLLIIVIVYFMFFK